MNSANPSPHRFKTTTDWGRNPLPRRLPLALGPLRYLRYLLFNSPAPVLEGVNIEVAAGRWTCLHSPLFN